MPENTTQNSPSCPCCPVATPCHNDALSVDHFTITQPLLLAGAGKDRIDAQSFGTDFSEAIRRERSNEVSLPVRATPEPTKEWREEWEQENPLMQKQVHGCI